MFGFGKPSEYEIDGNLDRYYKLDSKIYSCLNDVSKDDPEYGYWQRMAKRHQEEKDSLEKWFRKHGIDY
jgi:hypothetical protein